jgi:hypothetical protein
MTITISGPIDLGGEELDILCTAEVEPGCKPRPYQDDPGYGPSVSHAEVLDAKSRRELELTPSQLIELDELIMDKFYEEQTEYEGDE